MMCIMVSGSQIVCYVYKEDCKSSFKEELEHSYDLCWIFITDGYKLPFMVSLQRIITRDKSERLKSAVMFTTVTDKFLYSYMSLAIGLLLSYKWDCV